MIHGFALGYTASGAGSYAQGVAIAKSPLGKAAIAVAADDAAQRDISKTPQLARGGIITEPTYALIGEAGPEIVLPLVPTTMSSEKKPKGKRKVSAYSKQFGINLKALKKKHPRTPVTRLMKRAHTATRKSMK